MESRIAKSGNVYTEGAIAVMVRVSTGQQERDGTSLDTQLEGCMRLAELDGLTVDPDHIYREQWTGDDLDRPVLTLLRGVVQEGKIRVIYVYTSDRLSRDPLHLLMLMEEFASAGAEVRFVRGLNEDTPEGRLMMYISGYVGQKERLEFMERTMRGKMQTARLGRLPNGTGSGLYGYDYDRVNKVRLLNEEEAVVVRQAFQWCYDGWTAYRIALQAERDGYSHQARQQVASHQRAADVGECLRTRGGISTGRSGTERFRGRKSKLPSVPNLSGLQLEDFTPPLVSAGDL